MDYLVVFVSDRTLWGIVTTREGRGQASKLCKSCDCQNSVQMAEDASFHHLHPGIPLHETSRDLLGEFLRCQKTPTFPRVRTFKGGFLSKQKHTVIKAMAKVYRASLSKPPLQRKTATIFLLSRFAVRTRFVSQACGALLWLSLPYVQSCFCGLLLVSGTREQLYQ